LKLQLRRRILKFGSREVKKMPLFDIDVQLSGEDGNAFSILGRVQKAIHRAGGTQEDEQAFWDEATSDDYDKVLQTAMKYVNVH